MLVFFLVLLVTFLIAEITNCKKNKQLLTELQNSQKALEVQKRSLQAAIYHGGLFYWEYYPQEAKAVQSDVGTDAFHVTHVMENYPQSWMENDRIHKDDILIFMETDKKIKEGAQEVECRVREKLKGSYEWRLLKYSVVEKDTVTGKPIKVIGTDISVQKEEELKKLYSEQVNYREVLGVKSLLYAKLNLTGNVPESIFTHLNSMASNMQDVTEMYPTVDEFMEYVHNHIIKYGKINTDFLQAGTTDQLLQMLSAGRTHYETEFIYNFRDGYSRWVNGALDLLHNPLTGNAECFLYFTDIEAQKFMEQQDQERIAEALKKAKKASAYKSQFLSKVSHEMRTPLNAILGFCQLGKEETSLWVIQDYLSKINYSGNMLLNMVNNLLDMDQASGDSIKLHQEVLNLPVFFASLRKTMEPAFSEKHISFLLDVGKCEPIDIAADEKRLMQIFLHILNNSVKFTQPDGHVTLSVVSHPVENSKLPVTVSVKDDGIGMSEEFQKRLFQPFAQESEGITSAYNGVGLGLSLTKLLITAMGGSIVCQSKKGLGTEFIVNMHFPIAIKNTTIIDILPRRNNEDIMSVMSGTRALVAEDININYIIAQKLLENMGCMTDWAKNGQEAVDIFTAKGADYYDFILMDMRMPVMDGIKATKAIRKISRCDAETIPIIAMTANALDEDVEATREAGMNAHLSKPIKAEMLYHYICECLKKNKKKKTPRL